jgi:hypothetical protein
LLLRLKRRKGAPVGSGDASLRSAFYGATP